MGGSGVRESLARVGLFIDCVAVAAGIGQHGSRLHRVRIQTRSLAMPADGQSRLPHVLERYESEILSDWLNELSGNGVRRDDRIPESELRRQAQDFLRLTREATRSGN